MHLVRRRATQEEQSAFIQASFKINFRKIISRPLATWATVNSLSHPLPRERLQNTPRVIKNPSLNSCLCRPGISRKSLNPQIYKQIWENQVYPYLWLIEMQSANGRAKLTPAAECALVLMVPLNIWIQSIGTKMEVKSRSASIRSH